MAYTLTDDHHAQRKVYKAQNGHHNAYTIRRLLTESKVESDEKLARLVGLAAYEKAGGKITSDLFGKETYLDDAALLRRLANETLGAKAEKLKAEGWGWIEVHVDHDYGFTGKCGEIEARPTAAPTKLTNKHAKLQAEYDKVDSEWMDVDDEDPEYEDIYSRRDALQEQLEATEAELEGYKAFDPTEMKTAGCYVTISGDGKIRIQKGLVRPQGQEGRGERERRPANGCGHGRGETHITVPARFPQAAQASGRQGSARFEAA